MDNLLYLAAKYYTMRLLLFFLCLFLMSFTFGQDQETEDSLRKVLKKSNLSDVEIDRTKLELVKEIKKTKSQEGFELALEVIESQRKPTNILVEAHARAADCQFHLGSEELLNKYIDEAFRIGKENKLNEGLKTAYKIHYNAYKNFNREKAYEKNSEAVEFAEQIKDDEFSRIIFNNRGTLEYYRRDIEAAKKWFKKSLKQAEKLKNVEQVAGLSMNLGAMLYQEDKYEESLIYYRNSMKALQDLDNPVLSGQVYMNIAITKQDQRQLDSAIYYSERAIEKYVEAEDSINIASGYVQIGGIHSDNAAYVESNKWLIKALKLYDLFPNTDYDVYRVYKMLAENYSNVDNSEEYGRMVNQAMALAKKLGDGPMIADSYKQKSQYLNDNPDSLQVALECLDKAKEIYAELKLQRYIDQLNLDYGNIYQRMNQPKMAKPYFIKVLEFYEQNPDVHQVDIAGTLSNLGVLAYDLKQYDESILYYNRALEMRKQLGVRRDILDSYETLRNTYEAKQDYKNAFKYAKAHSLLKDSIYQEDLSMDLAEMRTKYESDKKEQENQLLQVDNELKNVELEKSELENERNKARLAISVGGIILVLLLALVSYRGYLRKRKDNRLLQQKNEEIQLQNIEIKEKSEEIMDSIRYAQRIQETILPANQLIKSYFSNSFIFYKPKELVSGDFYWMKSIEEESGNKLMFSAVDCTGHGVPGAFVSIVGHNGLNRAVNEYELRSPKLILEKLNEIVTESFAPNEEMSVKDGMDLAFCMIDDDNVLHYAGANNPLWIISTEETAIEKRITTENHERIRSNKLGELVFTEIKADKLPIGAYDGENVFNEHKVRLEKGDTIYVFSDGYADQFGGEHNKKMKSAKFKDMLIENYGITMSDQKDFLRDAFEDWKGNFEQIDDVCIIGYRFEG